MAVMPVCGGSLASSGTQRGHPHSILHDVRSGMQGYRGGDAVTVGSGRWRRVWRYILIRNSDREGVGQGGEEGGGEADEDRNVIKVGKEVGTG